LPPPPTGTTADECRSEDRYLLDTIALIDVTNEIEPVASKRLETEFVLRLSAVFATKDKT
jgi:hypothetical protein